MLGRRHRRARARASRRRRPIKNARIKSTRLFDRVQIAARICELFEAGQEKRKRARADGRRRDVRLRLVGGLHIVALNASSSNLKIVDCRLQQPSNLIARFPPAS